MEVSLRAALAAVWPVVVCVLFIQAGNGLQTDLIGLRADAAFAPGIVGLMMAAYFAGYCAASLASRTIIGRLGHIQTIGVSLTVAAVVIVAQPFLLSADSWIFLRMISGFAFSLCYVAVESWINSAVPNLLRGRIFSVYMLMQITGLTCAQGLLNVGDIGRPGPFLLAAGLFAAAAVVVAFGRRSAPRGILPRPLEVQELFRLSPFAASATVLGGLAWAVLFTFGPVYARRIGLDMPRVGLFMGVMMVAGGALQLPVGWLSDLIGRRAMIGLLFGAGLMASLCGLWAGSTVAVFIAVALVGACVFPIYAVAAAHINDRIPQDARIAAAAGLVLLFGLGSLIGPLLCGWVMGFAGASGFFSVLAVTMTAGLATVLYRPKQLAGRAQDTAAVR